MHARVPAPLLRYASLLTMAEELFPKQENLVGVERRAADEVIATILPPPSPTRTVVVGQPIDGDSEDEEENLPPPQTACGTRPDVPRNATHEDEVGSVTTAKVSFAHQRLDYEFRGPALHQWPLYFYVAGVLRLQRAKRHPSTFSSRRSTLWPASGSSKF